MNQPEIQLNTDALMEEASKHMTPLQLELARLNLERLHRNISRDITRAMGAEFVGTKLDANGAVLSVFRKLKTSRSPLASSFVTR